MTYKQHRLLVVEHDHDLLFIEMTKLQRAGYHVDGARDVDTALARLNRRDYDVIVTDLSLPRKSGNHLIAEACVRNIPRIAITAHEWDPLARVAREIGCDSVITKPFTLDQLLQAVEKSHVRLSLGKCTYVEYNKIAAGTVEDVGGSACILGRANGTLRNRTRAGQPVDLVLK